MYDTWIIASVDKDIQFISHDEILPTEEQKREREALRLALEEKRARKKRKRKKKKNFEEEIPEEDDILRPV